MRVNLHKKFFNRSRAGNLRQEPQAPQELTNLRQEAVVLARDERVRLVRLDRRPEVAGEHLQRGPEGGERVVQRRHDARARHAHRREQRVPEHRRHDRRVVLHTMHTGPATLDAPCLDTEAHCSAQ